MPDSLRVMVSGIGAVVGYGIAKQLFGSPDRYVIGADWSPFAVGRTWCDSFETSPPIATDEYIPWLSEVCSRLSVDVYMPGFEQETQVLAKEFARIAHLPTRFVVNSPELVTLASDKLRLSKVVQQRFPEHWIRTRAASDGFKVLAEEFGVPFVIKPRAGMASRGFRVVANLPEFDCAIGDNASRFIGQEYVGSEDSEYTVGVFATLSDLEFPAIVMRRRLNSDGSTGSAWRSDDDNLARVSRHLSRSLKAVGPTNLQFRVDGERLALLEINPRFSSSTSLRHAFGYAEAEMAVQFFWHGQIPEQPVLRGTRATRFWSDHVV